MALESFDSVTSTMDVARERLVSRHLRFDSDGRLAFQGVIARQQTAGRGQRGRAWYGVPEQSLFATYYFRRSWVRPETAGILSLLAGAVVAEILQRIIAEEIQHLHAQAKLRVIDVDIESETVASASDLLRVGLKWPNDLLLRGKKVGGILVEMTHLSEDGWVALIGVGINVNQTEFPPELTQTATSLHREGIPMTSVPQLGEQIAHALDASGSAYTERLLDQIIARWRAFDETTGRSFQTEYEGHAVVGIAQGVDDSGALQLRLEDGRHISVQTASLLHDF